MTSPEPKLSVLMLTYQHEAFLAEALDSVLSQKTRFPFEIVVGDDCSYDQTRQILLTYQEEHPDTFRLLLHDENIGIRENFRATIEACRGELVAILEGDDFWTDARKLQRQADLLDAHPKASLCGHQSVTVKDGEIAPESAWPHHGDLLLSVENALDGTLFHTCTMMFRRHLIAGFPRGFWTIFPPDRALQILLAEAGDVGFIGEVMAAYRVHPGGTWSARSRAERRAVNLEFFRRLDELIAPKYRPRVQAEIYRRWRSHVRETAREGSYLKAFRHYAALLGSPRVWLHRPKAMISPSLWVSPELFARQSRRKT